MEKDEIKFSLLEIMEGPKRINSISHTLLFDYLLEAAQEQDRFEAFMKVLLKNAWWAYYGICIMASDILPTDTLFDEEKNDLQDIKYRHGSVNELTIFNMLMSYFERGLFEFKKHRTYFVRYMAETLSSDEYDFCVGCIYKRYGNEVLPRIKQMYENGRLARQVHQFFSFCMNHNHDKVMKFTPSCVPVMKMTKYWKIGDMIFDTDKKLLDKQKSMPIINFIKKTSMPSRNFAGIQYPMICELWVEDVIPFMAATTSNAFVLRRPEYFDDKRFIELFYSGYKDFVCVNQNMVISIISEENGFVSTETVKAKEIKIVHMPLLILGISVNIVLLTVEEETLESDEQGEGEEKPKKKKKAPREITAFAPSSFSATNGSEVKLAKFNNTYYVCR